jgi:hypothetical protein
MLCHPVRWMAEMRLIIIIFFLLAGCTISQETYGPNGERIKQIECGQALPQLCRNEAEKKCPNGYNVLNEGLTFTSYALVIQCAGSEPLNEALA